jgi:hypothetical protein
MLTAKNNVDQVKLKILDILRPDLAVPDKPTSNDNNNNNVNYLGEDENVIETYGSLEDMIRLLCYAMLIYNESPKCF